MKQKFYRLDRIKKYNAKYNVVFGMRSNGKTFACLEEGVQKYCTSGKQLAIVRRWDEDFRSGRADQMFTGLVSAGVIAKLTGGEWNNVYYRSRKWYFSRWDNKQERTIIADEPFAFAFAISQQEHDKSTSYENVSTVLFDEFITRGTYLPDEFVLFTNTLSTIIRRRTDVTIYMCANTVNRYCPYFAEMGLNHIKQMKPGDIDVYTYGENGAMTVAVEYCKDESSKEISSNMYFAFDNPKLKMITEGEWELALYPHCPSKYKPKDIAFSYFIIFGDSTLQADVIVLDTGPFTFIHKKTSPIKDDDSDLIFSLDYSHKHNYIRNILKPSNNVCRRITQHFLTDKVFYQDNSIGDTVHNYLELCKAGLNY